MGNWGSGAEIGALYRIRPEDFGRVGCCWMAGRLKDGDLVLCVAHSGDCFFDYILIYEYANGIEGIPGSSFGAYTLGSKVDYTPSAKACAMLKRGEFVPVAGDYALRSQPAQPFSRLGIEAKA
jgi:hypothetical protein